MEDWLKHLFTDHGHYVLFVTTFSMIVFCGMGLPIPEEATFIAAGIAAQQLGFSRIELLILCAIGVAGIIAGDSIPFLLGRYWGDTILKHRFLVALISEKKIEKARGYFREHGNKTVFCARFVAGLRMPTFLIAATMGFSYWSFVFWDGLGALISCPTSIVLAYLFGEAAKHMMEKGDHALLVVLAILIGGGIIFGLWKRKKSRQKKDDNNDESHRDAQPAAEAKTDNLPPNRPVHARITK